MGEKRLKIDYYRIGLIMMPLTVPLMFLQYPYSWIAFANLIVGLILGIGSTFHCFYKEKRRSKNEKINC